MTNDPLSGNRVSLGQCSAGDKRKEGGMNIPHCLDGGGAGYEQLEDTPL